MHVLGSVMFPTQHFETLVVLSLIQGFINFFVLSFSEIWIQISYLCLRELLSLVLLV